MNTKKEALATRLRRKFEPGEFSHKDIDAFVGQFTDSGLDQWLADLKERHLLSEQTALDEIFSRLYDELLWIHQNVIPPLAGMPGIADMENVISVFTSKNVRFDEKDILQGQTYMREHGQYRVCSNPETLIDYTRVERGIEMRDFDGRTCFLLHSSSGTNTHDSPLSVNVTTSPTPDFRIIQSMRLEYFDEENQPTEYNTCVLVRGDICTFTEKQIVSNYTFVTSGAQQS